MNKLYKELYKQKLFSLDEANKIIKNYQVCKNNVQRLIFQGYLKTIRLGVYHIVPLDNPDFYPDNIHIASKLRQSGIIACNSALFAHMIATENSENKNATQIPIEQKNTEYKNTVYILSKYNSKLRIKETTYKILRNKYTFGITEISYNAGYVSTNIKITDIERTILDCLRTKTMRFEDLLINLRTAKPRLDISKIISYLEKFKIPLLYNKTGLLLEMLETQLLIKEDDLDKIRKKITKKIYYLREKGIKLAKPKYKYNKLWNIMIPEELVKYSIPSIKPQLIQEEE